MRLVKLLRNSTVLACFRHVPVEHDALTKGWVKNLVDLYVFICHIVSIALFHLPENSFRESERPIGFSIGVQNGLMIPIF